jgi:predicted MFS family arabinose efflux permease
MPLGYVAAYSLGGWLNDAVGWREAFFLFGIPGVLLAVLIRLTVREPERGMSEGRRFTLRPPRFMETIRYFLSQPTLRYLPIAGSAHSVGMAAVGVWLPAFFMRTYDMSSTEIGLKLALILCIGGLGGTLAGGYVADRLVQRYRDARWYPGVCCAALVGSLPFTLCMYVTNDAWLSLALFFFSSILNHALLGPVLATVQNLGGVSRRAMVAAFYLFVVNLVSFGLGPVFIGALSDFFTARFGSDALRYALMTLTTGTAMLAAMFFALAARTVRRDLTRVEI